MASRKKTGKGESKTTAAPRRAKAKAKTKTSQRKSLLALPEYSHNVDIAPGAGNYLRWGTLVMSWITNPNLRPITVGGLRTAMARARVEGTVFGGEPDNPDRRVRIEDYPGTGPVVIPLPTIDMINRDKRIIARIQQKPVGERFYPVPNFYSAIYGGAGKVDMDRNDMEDMMLRRLGEYVVNECM